MLLLTSIAQRQVSVKLSLKLPARRNNDVITILGTVEKRLGRARVRSGTMQGSLLADLHVTANGSSSLLPRRRMQDRSLSCNREGLCASTSPAGVLR